MKDRIKELHQQINKEIHNLSFGKNPESLYNPLNYILALGGKRIRPLLTMLAYQMFKINPGEIILQAVAVEVFHNFTLMHDDIMDKAPLRRGNPTVHQKWGENNAILSGDVMMVKAYEMLLTSDPELVFSVLSAFSKCATEVCEGQQLDMDFEEKETVTESEYIEMVRLKTAVLLGFSAELGGILAGVDKPSCLLLRSFGTNIGIGFQLMDDLLDIYGDAAKFGKQAGGDIIANKKTFLMIEAFEKSSSKERKTLDYWINVQSFDPEEKIREVKKVYDQIGIKEITRNKMNIFFSEGLEMLNKIEVEEANKELLRTFILGLINREN